MATIYDVVNPKFIATRWEESETDRVPYLLSAFFPERKQMGIELSYLQGNSPKVRPLDLSAFDVKVLPLSREAFNKITTEMPFFKNALSINEKMRQELLKVLSTGNQQYIDVVLGQIYNDNKTLLDDANVTREVMRAQLLTTGSIAFASNGQAVSYDFGVPSANKKTLEGTAKWSASDTADPVNDIIGWQDAIENTTGVRPTNLLMNRVTFNLMKKAASIKDTILASFYSGKTLVSDAVVKNFIMEQTGCTIYVYDKGYTSKDTGNFTKFVADNVVVLFPEGAMGEFVFGTTPEEADLMNGATDAEVSIVDLGVALTTIKEKDPVNVMTKVSMVALPTLEKPNQMIIATVA